MNNYTVFHLHSMLSNGITNIDSVTKFDEYINYAHELGMTSIGFSEHGSVFEHIKKRQTCEKLGMKYLHGEEFYVTEKLVDGNGYKIKDNYHVVIIAKNYDGYLELNKLSTKAFNRATVKMIDDKERYYYSPRITFDELISTSDNLIITTACLGGILNKGSDKLQERFIRFLADNKDRCFLEVQHHLVSQQIEYNKKLLSISNETGIRLIAGTDTHCLNEKHQRGRKILQKSKNINFDDEDGWDLTFKTYDELVVAYEKQNSLPKDVYFEAINNTNVMADMVEMYHITNEYKYPHLWSEPDKLFKEKINKGFKNRGCNKFPNKDEYRKRALYEYDTYKNNGMIEFMLLSTEMIEFCNEHDIKVGFGRGSVNGSVVAWILGITEMDSIKHQLNFERFASPERQSLADVDTDLPSNKRDEVKQYLFNREGLNCCDIITFNTIALRGAIRDVARALEIPRDDVAAICDLAEEYRDEARELYPELMEYVDIVEGTIVSIGTHPCGCVVSDYNIAETFGLCTTSTSNYPVSQIYMKEIDSLNYVKLDLLCLDTIQLINDTCELIGIPRYTPDNIDVNDDKVWDSIRDDTTMIFQWESDQAQDYIKKILSDETILKFESQGYSVDKMMLLTIGNGAIRPAGASYRDDLANGVVRKTGCKAIDDAMSSTFGYCVFQCQIIEFLHKCCGFTMGEADIVRRGFAKKTGTEQFIPIIKDGGYLNENKYHYIKGFIKTMKEEYGYDEDFSERVIVDFIKVIEDASEYLFSINHSQPYSYEGYVSGYLRYYYPLEFITCALNINLDKPEKTVKITEYAKKRNIEISPPKYRHSISKYIADKESGKIYKGLQSIKYLNETIAEQLYDMRNMQFESFLDFLKVNPCNSKQTEILIKLDFFSEFGKSGKLMNIFNFYQSRYKKDEFKKQIKKDNNPYPIEIIGKYSKETEKQYNIVDEEGFCNEVISTYENKELPITERLTAQLEYLGYIEYINPKAKNYGMIIEINTKYAPRFSVYKLDTGEIISIKMDKKTYSMMDIKEKDVIKYTTKKKYKKKLVDGHWTESDEKELWLNQYVIKQ